MTQLNRRTEPVRKRRIRTDDKIVGGSKRKIKLVLEIINAQIQEIKKSLSVCIDPGYGKGYLRGEYGAYEHIKSMLIQKAGSGCSNDRIEEARSNSLQRPKITEM